MIADNDIEQARSRFDVISAEVPLKRRGRELIGLCPFHGERTPSFAVIPDKGFFHCQGCGAHGTAIDYVMRTRNSTFVEAVRELLGLPVLQPQINRQKMTRPAERPDDVAAARAIWAGASATERDLVQLYFTSRYVRWAIPPTIRQHPGLYCAETDSILPALVAAFKDSAGVISAVQRIWLGSSFSGVDGGDPHGSRVGLKKTRGEMRDGCVRLGPLGDDEKLGLAEGIETGAAVMNLFKRPVVWATCGLARLGFPAHWRLMQKGERPQLWVPPERPPAGNGAIWVEERAPTIWVPPQVKRLTIFGDNGTIGHQVADYAAGWYCRRGIEADAQFPPDDPDFADQLRAQALAGQRPYW